MDEDRAEYGVVQWFPDGSYEYVRRYVKAEEAFKAFLHYCSSIGAQLGTTRRVIIEDGGGYTNAEWKYGEGFTYPPELVEVEKAKKENKDV